MLGLSEAGQPNPTVSHTHTQTHTHAELPTFGLPVRPSSPGGRFITSGHPTPVPGSGGAETTTLIGREMAWKPPTGRADQSATPRRS